MTKVSFNAALTNLAAKSVANMQAKDATVTTTKNEQTIMRANALLKRKEVTALLNECGIGAIDLTRTMYVTAPVVFLAHELTQDSADARKVKNDNFILGLRNVVAFMRAQERGEAVIFTRNILAHAMCGHKLDQSAAQHLIVTRSIIGETQLNYTLNFLQRIKVLVKVGDRFEIKRNAILDRAIEKFAL